MNAAYLEKAIFVCGIGHFGLCIGSLYIPKALRWKIHLVALQPLLKQMFWTYAAYILVINLWFGIISVFGADELVNGSFLGKSITLFIGIYWLTRILIQFFYFDRSQSPKGLLYGIGEIALIGLFVLFTVTYLSAFLLNNEWI